MLAKVDWSQFIQRNREIYNKMREDRYGRLETFYHGNIDEIVPWDGKKATYLWDFFPPAWNCPWRERLGRFSEGGKVVCNVDALNRRDAVVYSYGVRDDISFELSLTDRTNVTIYTFDPTVSRLPHSHPRIEFNEIGLSATTSGKMESLEYTMRRLGHRRIDLLKVDCEGCEWQAFTSNVLQHVDQLLIELHFQQHTSNNAGNSSYVREVFELFEILEESGLYPFSWEVNPSGYFGQKPWAIEYSFVRWNSKYMISNEFPSERSSNVAGLEHKEHKPAIVYLAGSEDHDIKNLNKSVGLLNLAFPSKEVPVLIFYDSDSFLNHSDEIRETALATGFKGHIEIVYINLTLPDGCCDFEPSWNKRTKFGYHNMIRFWIKDLWNTPVIRDKRITHIMRLDTDSYLSKVQTDASPDLPEGVLYRGNTMQYDSLQQVVHGFYEFVKSTVNTTEPKNPKIIRDILESWETSKRIPIIYNNFFIASVEFFQRPEVMKLAETICCSAPDYYVYRYRWGDAIIHYFLLGMFAKEQEIILNAPANGYSHG